MGERLRHALSPYLRSHADNPVDWWEWGDEAFAEAQRRDVPVFLSVGYAACHWCHVMAEQSFEDEDVASLLNASFIAIKVDREERPDVDAAYMSAVTALNRSGGWPMSVFLTPDGRPFHGGTYFPREVFLQLLASITQVWAQRRQDVLQAGDELTSHLAQLSARMPHTAVGTDVLAAAVDTLAREFDTAHAGFGGAPKFPASMVLEFLLRHHARTGDPVSMAMAAKTCTAMARGGLYDQLAGGFARYSVDRTWTVPHFEKMLYDNAQLLGVYARWFRASGEPLAYRVTTETADFLLTDLATDEGGFASALDADAAGVEGLTYAWSPAELTQVLGTDDGQRAARLLAVTAQGTFEHGRSTLQLPHDPDDPTWWAATRTRLLAARADRPQPARDDKVVTSWNGLAIAALTDAAVIVGEPRYLRAAIRCAEFVVARHIVDGRLRRASRDGRVGAAPGLADDYGNLAQGLLALHQATGDRQWLTAAEALLETALAHFAHPDGGFTDRAGDADPLYLAADNAGDNAEPAGQSALAGAMLTFGALTGSTRHLDAARAAVDAAGLLAARQPRFAGWTLAVAEARAAGPVQVAVVGSDDAAHRLRQVVERSTSPGLVRAFGEPDTPGIPLLADRPLRDGESAAYVCTGSVCQPPITSVDELREALAGGAGS